MHPLVYLLRYFFVLGARLSGALPCVLYLYRANGAMGSVNLVRREIGGAGDSRRLRGGRGTGRRTGCGALGLRVGIPLVSTAFQLALDSLSVCLDALLSVGVVFGLVVVHAEAAGAAGLDGPELHDHPLSYCPGFRL